MTSAQTTLPTLNPVFCEYSEPCDNYFRCKLTDFGFLWRCTKEERLDCPDLEYFRKNKLEAKIK